MGEVIEVLLGELAGKRLLLGDALLLDVLLLPADNSNDLLLKGVLLIRVGNADCTWK